MKNKLFGCFPLAIGLGLIVSSAAVAPAAGLKMLSAPVQRAVARLNLKPLGNFGATNRLHLAIGVPLRNQRELNNLLQQLYDPASPSYHHFLTPQQFTEMFGPSAQEYQAVIAFAKTNGLVVTGTYSNRMLVDVSGTVGNIQKAFHVTMHLYRHPTEKRDFYAPNLAPSVPSALPILDVNGLNDYVLPRPLFVHRPTNALSMAKQALTGSAPDGSGSYFGYDFRNAYAPGVSLTGAGQTVALFECADYFDSDVAQYVRLAGLPGIPLQRVLVEGYEPPPVAGDGVNGEVALDIEMVNCMAPGLSKIIVYETPADTTAYVGDMLARIALDDSAKQISSSWLIGDSPQYIQFYLEFAAQGQSFFQASGDEDAYYPGIFQYEDGTNVTLVGGTTLSTAGPGGPYKSETVWNWGNEYGALGAGIGSGGGVSTNYPIPSWQQGIDMTTNQGSTTMRNIPDVALTADNIFIIADDGVYEPGTGGTSAAAPLWAGFMALVNQQAAQAGKPPVGFLNPMIYAIGKGPNYTSDFHDITNGDNTSPFSPDKYNAVPGYDLCTGWGTPNGVNLINALAPGAGYGFLTFSVNPPSGSALIASSDQPIYVTVNDVNAVTNAIVTATIPGVVTNLLFSEGGSLDGIYGNTVKIPSAGPLAMTVRVTATDEIGVTNVVYYSVIAAPPNDNFTNATKVPVAGGSYVENNRFASLELGEPKHDGYQNDAASLWWAWTPTANTNVFVDTVGSRVDNVLAVYTGRGLADLQAVAATNSSLTPFKPAQLSFEAQAYTTYYIAVAGQNSSSLGSVNLHITPNGQPDTTSPVLVITSPQSGTNAFTRNISVSGTASDPGANSSGIKQVFVSFNGNTPIIAVGTTNWTTLVALQPEMNTIQAYAVDEAGNVSSTKTIEVNYFIPPLANDFFANAISLNGLASPVLATNTDATKEVGEPNPAGNSGGKSLWWSYTPSQDGVLTLSTMSTNTTFDTIMGLYTGPNVANLTPIAEDDDAYSGVPGGFSYISQAITNDQTYYILVDGYNGASGRFSLSYTFSPEKVYHLNVNNSGGGTIQLLTTNTLGGISILPGTSADFASSPNSTVTLMALPDHNDQFDVWSGDKVSLDNPFTFEVTRDLNITADFTNRVFTDGFESGDFSHLPWVTPDSNRTNDFRWIVQTNVADVGQYAAESWTNLMDSQSSSLILTTNFVAGAGSFDFKVSSEENWDFLQFYVNGNLQQQWSGQVGWSTYSFTLPTNGMYTLKWTYVKDPTISMGLDTAFIDDVVLPIALAPDNTTAAQLQLQQQTSSGLFVNLTGQSGQQYIVQTSPDLVHWQNVSTNIAYGGFIRVPLPANATNRTQFYRAVAP